MRYETASREIPSRATCVANSGLSHTTPSARFVKSAGCKASDFRKVSSAQSTFGRSGSATQEMPLAKLGSRPRGWFASSIRRASTLCGGNTADTPFCTGVRGFLAARVATVFARRELAAPGTRNWILVLFLPFFEIHAILAFLIKPLSRRDGKRG